MRFRGNLSPVQKLRQRRGLEHTDGQTDRQTHTHTQTRTVSFLLLLERKVGYKIDS